MSRRISRSCAEPRAHASCSSRRSSSALPALGIADRNSLAGIVRAYEAAKETGVRLVVGCRLDLADGTSLLVYPTDRAAYSRLCRLLSIGKGRAGKGKCALLWDDVVAWNEGLLAVLLGDEADEVLAANLKRLKATFGDRAYMALIRRFAPNDHVRLWQVEEAARAAGVPTRRDGRCPLPSSEPPHAAGCRHLHPPEMHHRRGRLPSGAACRPLSEGP